ncbi:MAG: phosphoglucosamine mutase, partial [Deltaproteobacteria bacterium]|nr:phosphoglucosamine mutase [Deltaproteobacteria bacterium]
RVGRGIAYISKNENRRHRILIGKDTRLSGYMVESALTAGICSMGVDILLVGPLPTPGIAFMTVSMRADAGVIISASHNSFQDNGIKIFNRDGFKLPDELESRIEELVFSNSFGSLCPTANEIGKAYRIDDAVGRYIMFLKNTFPKQLTLEGLRIVLDCAHGAAYKVGPAVFEELGADLISLGVDPDGENINLNCGSLHPEVVSEAVKKTGANIGITLDGDADRVIFVDEHGEEVDGDHIMAICAREMIQNNTLRKNTLVTTIMSNMGLKKALEPLGGRIVKTRVGDRYVVEELQKGGYNLGGEKSGHLIFLDYNTTGDGILSALRVLSIMIQKGKTLSELSQIMQPFPQILINVDVKGEKDFYQIPAIANQIKKLDNELKDRGRVVVRPSGTESKIRVMVEGEDEKKIKILGHELADIIKKNLG